MILKGKLTFTMPPMFNNMNPAPTFVLPFEFDPYKASLEGYSTGFYTMSHCAIGFEVDADGFLDPDPRKVVSVNTPNPQKTHLINEGHDCDYTLCGNLPLHAVRRRRVSEASDQCVPCFIRAGLR